MSVKPRADRAKRRTAQPPSARHKLWTRDFSFMTASTILAAIGGEALNLPVSLLVFDQTGSTLDTAGVAILGLLPDLILPLFLAPALDRQCKKPWLVVLNLLQSLAYLIMALSAAFQPFSLSRYYVFTVAVASLSSVYQVAYQAWYPDLITPGCEQQAFSVSGLIYPSVVLIMAPLGTWLYQAVPISRIFALTAGLSLLSVLLEIQIRPDPRPETNTAKTPAAYLGLPLYLQLPAIWWQLFRHNCSDFKQALVYLRHEAGLKNIYLYMSITNGVSNSIAVLTQAFFQSRAYLGSARFGWLKSAETAGRLLGGWRRYHQPVSRGWRYRFSKWIYTIYDSFDASLLLLPFPLMLLNRFICGYLGISSATVREAAVQTYLRPDMRAKVNALLNSILSGGGLLFYYAGGFLGQYYDYRLLVALLGLLTLGANFVLIWRKPETNGRIYEWEAPPGMR
ncbi:MFS transporter [Oscillospiraceae bacterium HV4-5-C5C]|nr:MFS transporter [Oscillospiraceae bacterium HV4-5-C5C]